MKLGSILTISVRPCTVQLNRSVGSSRPVRSDLPQYNCQVGASELLPAVLSQRSTLSNGLTVITHPVHTAPLVSVWCWYRVGSRDERPGLTGVSHWVEHMNFKGTTNIPRDEMKGIIEQFGGSWNGYTWIDQTTYSRRRAATRSIGCCSSKPSAWPTACTSPHDCESERTVIISELQGGENDPDQLLDTGGHRHGVPRAPLPASDDRLARRSADDDARRSLRLLPPLLRAEQRHARHRRRRRRRRGAAPRGASTSGRFPPGSAPDASSARRAGADRRAPGDRRATRARRRI